ncbi:MAG: hypothetical protein AMXMBFR64_08150 [Myxococcales bacterium]
MVRISLGPNGTCDGVRGPPWRRDASGASDACHTVSLPPERPVYALLDS